MPSELSTLTHSPAIYCGRVEDGFAYKALVAIDKITELTQPQLLRVVSSYMPTPSCRIFGKPRYGVSALGLRYIYLCGRKELYSCL